MWDPTGEHQMHETHYMKHTAVPTTEIQVEPRLVRVTNWLQIYSCHDFLMILRQFVSLVGIAVGFAGALVGIAVGGLG